MYELFTFDNGIRLATVPMPHAYSISVSVCLTIGSRYEEDRLAGASHFVEHMLFKGTERRPTPREIALAIEGIGGDINASTGREMTSYYARVSHDHLPVAADVLVDMLRHSRFLPVDVERERQVITEEINEALDTPDELVLVQFEELIWPNHPLGRDVAGTRKSVREMGRDELLQYMYRSYTPGHMVIAVAGPVDHKRVQEQFAPLLQSWNGGNGIRPAPVAPFEEPVARATYRPVEQCHFMLGTRGIDRFDEERFAFNLMDIILSDGMSSRLFTDIREERGLAYSVHSYTMQLHDTGTFGIYAGVDSQNLQEALQAVLEQLNRLREEPVSEEELAMAKAYARGRTLLRLEDSAVNAGWAGSQLALTGEIRTPEEILSRLDQVTAEDIQRVARRLFRDNALALSLVGPVDEDADWKKLLKVE